MDCSIPDEEIARLRSLIPTNISLETIQHLKALQEATEYKTPPIILQIPRQLCFQGRVIDCTIEHLKAIWESGDKRIDTDHPLRDIYLIPHMSHASKSATWNGTLRAYTSGHLKGSREMNYPAQQHMRSQKL